MSPADHAGRNAATAGRARSSRRGRIPTQHGRQDDDEGEATGAEHGREYAQDSAIGAKT
jgi:hypothetical protein